jgi:predicted nucleotidyltransferase
MEEELSRMAGRKVDLQTMNFFSPEIRSSVNSVAVPVFQQA